MLLLICLWVKGKRVSEGWRQVLSLDHNKIRFLPSKIDWRQWTQKFMTYFSWQGQTGACVAKKICINRNDAILFIYTSALSFDSFYSFSNGYV